MRAGESCPFYHPPFLPRVQKGPFPLAPAVATLSSIETPPHHHHHKAHGCRGVVALRGL